MKRQNRLSPTSVALFALGACALAVVTPQSVFAAGASSSKVIVLAQANKAEMQDTDEGKAKKDTQATKQVKHPGKPKQVGRKGGPDPKVRAAKRAKKMKLIEQDRLRGTKAAAAVQKKQPAEKKGAQRAKPGDDDMGEAPKDTEYVKEAKREAKPKEAGRGDRRDPKLRAEKRKAKLKLLAKDRQ